MCERVCWVVPRDRLRVQANEAFVDPGWRAALGHEVSVRAAENAADPCRGLAGDVTTCQGVAAAIGPRLALASVWLLLSGTQKRADGRRILRPAARRRRLR